jgi:lysozyme family protein
MNFESVIDGILDAEAPNWRTGDSGYTDDPSDRGGPTAYGITVAVARKNGYFGQMQELPLTLARSIYRNRYIVEPAFDKVALINEGVAAELIDTGVNCGPARAAEFFQRCLNAFNTDGSRYADVFADGRIGEVTLAAFRAYRRWRGVEGAGVMVCALNSLQGERYIEIAENNPSQRKYTYGWIKERVLKPAAA